MLLPRRSFVIPVLDFSPHSPYNIRTLLKDLEAIDGEVICVFNAPEPFEELRDHARVDKFCLNKQNVGVSRAWNIGLQLTEAPVVFVLNADLHVGVTALDRLEEELFELDRAVIVGPQGSYLDYRRQAVKKYFSKGTFSTPVRTDDVSGFFFAIHLDRFRQHGLLFDVQFSPCLGEEWDMGLQARRAGLCCYAVPVTDFEHHWGISRIRGTKPIRYFGREMQVRDIRSESRRKLTEKWRPIFPELFG
jgi:GT2 family glycosyltransferase